jgi:hypothetical protein
VIGLVFIFLLYSLLATILQEIIATIIGLRARVLKKGIKRMLDDGEKSKPLSALFYRHPLIKYLAEGKNHSKPSYLSAQNFSKVLIDLLRGKDAKPGEDFTSMIQKALDDKQMKWEKIGINEETSEYLKSLWADAQGDVDKFKSMLEKWFDDTMERAIGWYKKRVQLILFGIGLFIAIFFNVDTISISQKLSRDPKLAEQLANNASAYMKTHEALGEQLRENTAKQKNTLSPKDSITIENTSAALDSIDLAVINKANSLIDSANAMIKADIANVNHLLALGWECHCPSICKCRICFNKNFHWWSIIGWLVTALAISLGAPFWFDLLNKLMKIKGTGKNSGENSEKEPKESKRADAANQKE